VLAGIAGVHVEAEGAVVELGGANLDQLGQLRLDITAGHGGQRHHRVVELG
jgi:hypothetical protein